MTDGGLCGFILNGEIMHVYRKQNNKKIKMLGYLG